ncbi:hypothetical protein GCM10009689_29070 [Brevibacterium antiquum]|uniref:hypothetical protein n=1 Tax=Brevibacterium antiquum TaxID=234835 RepID=UPI001E439F38|nr:hypothetical protein [Brevibacterium antiquum]
MIKTDTQTKHKLRETGATALLDAFGSQDEHLTMGLSFDERLQLIIVEARSGFNRAKVGAHS